MAAGCPRQRAELQRQQQGLGHWGHTNTDLLQRWLMFVSAVLFTVLGKNTGLYLRVCGREVKFWREIESCLIPLPTAMWSAASDVTFLALSVKSGELLQIGIKKSMQKWEVVPLCIYFFCLFLWIALMLLWSCTALPDPWLQGGAICGETTFPSVSPRI